MFRILIKEVKNSLSTVIAFSLIFIFLFPLLLWLDVKALEFFLVISSGIYIIFMTTGNMLFSESYEEKNNGFCIMNSLPVKVREIVAAKFLKSLLLTFLSFVIVLLQNTIYISSENLLSKYIVNFSFFSAGASLLIVSVAYLGIYKMGLTKFLRIILPTFFILGVLIQFLLILLTAKNHSAAYLFETFKQFLLNTNWILVTLCVIGIFFLIMYATIKVKIRNLALDNC